MDAAAKKGVACQHLFCYYRAHTSIKGKQLRPLFIVLLTLVLASCNSVLPPTTASLGNPFQLKLGQTATLEDGLDELDVNGNCWQPTDAPTTQLTNAAASPQVDPARFLPPPGTVRDFWIATFTDHIGGSITETRYALLDDGRVWAWTYQTNMLTNASQGFDSIIGAGIGLCCMGALALLVWALLAATIWRSPTAKTTR